MTNVKLNKWSEKLRQSLAKSLRSWTEEQREAMAVTIETELPEWLREAFGLEVESVYDLTLASTLISYRNMIASNEVAKRTDAESAGRFDHALKLFRDFLESKLGVVASNRGLNDSCRAEEEISEVRSHPAMSAAGNRSPMGNSPHD